MNTRKMILLFFGVKGIIVLAPLSFIAVHYMVTGAAQTSGPDINSFDNGLTKLMYAAQRNDLSAAQKLVNTGADLVNTGADLDLQSTNIAPNYRNPDNSPKIDGSTALHMACATLDNPTAADIVRLLVNAGANVRIKNKSIGDTPLHNAFFYTGTFDDRVLPLIERLVKNGADINARNDDGNTLVHYAVDKMRRDWLENLLSGRFGALVDRTVKNNKNEQHEAMNAEEWAGKWHADLLDYFKKPAPVYTLKQRDPNGLTGLMIAVIRGNADVVKTVPLGDSVLNEKTIEQGQDKQDKYEYTALHLAILHQRPEMVTLLMERGADPDVKDVRGNAPLHLIYKLGSFDERKKVIQALMNSEQKSSTARHANLNIQDTNGNTLLHLAVERKDQVLIQFLLATYPAQLNIKVQNGKGDTPGQRAKALGYTDIQNLLGA